MGGRIKQPMSKKGAAWNAGIQFGLPLLGLLLTLVAGQATVAPTAVFVAVSALYVAGFGLFFAAKLSVFRAGRYFSMGSQSMATGARRAYRTGYLLMGLGCIGALGLIIAAR